MMPPLPVLVITADRDCLVTVSGSFAGVCALGGFVPFPVGGDGEYFVRAEPLSDGAFALTRRIAIRNGAAECAGGSAELIAWPDGVYELSLTLPRAPRTEERPAPLASLSVTDARRLTLYSDRGLRLSLEEGGRPLAGCALGDGDGGELGLYECDGRKYIGVLLEKRLLAFDGQLNTLLDEDCASCSFTDGRPVAVKELKTFRRHRTRLVYGFAGASFAVRSSGADGAGREPVSAPERAVCCVEAVREGFFTEALTYMSAELKRGLDLAAVRGFLGEFDEARPAFGGSSRQIGLILRKQGSPTEVRLLEIEYRDGLVDNISEP